ncbi:MAG TPA: GerMN domain-containing protein [Candidatus Ornithomonoglobus intestinigallinarum]|uniref:GerMN domain-containing protein n=1 Tax=Candidatus Ornithomonoglobus intestinigallinarum TaxID=2840894 RepID=A0A9D1KP36_9FIRM|nr:GerMN domain-containing protein [Candidatus Ornithomonoglobus intestinigallinarum]
MKRIIFILIILTAFGIAAVSFGTSVPQTEVRLYFTDAQILKLLPVRVMIPELTPEEQAKLVIKALIEGDDDNLKIRRTIPDIRGCMSVKVKGEIAYVDIKRKMIENHSEGRDIELLTVYSIVNSLASVKGITNVRFTIEGEVSEDFMGYLDMRETFIPDYTV